MVIEENHFKWLWINQKKLRIGLYQGLMDAISKDDVNAKDVGKKTILPSSFTGNPRSSSKLLECHGYL